MILLSQTVIFTLFAVVIVVIAILMAFGNAMQTQNKRREFTATVVRHFGATIKRDSWSKFQWFSFERDGYAVHVRIDKPETKKNIKASMIQVRIPWPEATARMNVYPETVPDKLKKFIGLEDIVIGSPKFDREFIVQGNQTTVREVLTPDVQRMMSGIAAEPVSRNAHFSIVDSGFYVRKRIPKGGSAGLAISHIESSLRLHQLMLKSGNAAIGISFIEQPAIREVQPNGFILKTHPTCLVCGDDIVQQKVKCRSCKTPHHLDCWTYIGQCSVYGCGQQAYKA